MRDRGGGLIQEGACLALWPTSRWVGTLFGGGCLLEHGRLYKEIQYLKICSTNGQHNSVCPYFFVVIVFPLTTFVDVEVDLKFPERRK